MAVELTYFPVSGYLGATTVNGAELPFNATVICTPRLPAGFTARISNLDTGGGTGAETTLAFPPQIFTSSNGVVAGFLLANDATVLGPALAAAGITQLWYDVNFTQVSLGYQIQNFSFPAPTTTTAVSLTGPALTRYAYGGTVPTVSLPAGVTAFGVSLIGAANLAAAQALLGITTGAGYLGSVASQAAMLALSAATVGEYCYRTDADTFYYLIATPASTAANWVTPESLVQLEPVAVKTSAYTAAPGQIIPCDATSAAFTVTLPTAPIDAAQVVIKKIDTTTNAVTYACGGSDVINKTGGVTSGSLLLTSQAVVLQYYAASQIWYVVSTDAPLGQLDTRYGVATTTGLALVTAASVAAAQTALSLTPGTNVPAYNGALGTPSSGVLTNLTGSPTLTAPALGTPASGTLTNCTGLPVAGGGTGVASLTGIVKGAGTAAFAAAVAGTDYVAPGGALGTPASGVLTNCTGLPIAGVTNLSSTRVAYTTTQTGLTVPTGVTGVWIESLIAPGGGGGSGRRGAAASVRCGGGGGASGAMLVDYWIPAALLSSTFTVTLPAAGAGGAAVTTDSTNGNNGTASAAASFASGSNTWSTFAGSAGAGGTATTGAGGSFGQGGYTGAAGGSASATGGVPAANTNNTTNGASSGGGAGGGITSGDSASAGGSGGLQLVNYALTSAAGGVVGGASPGTGNAATAGVGGLGAGGGAASITAAAQAGATPTGYGAGGGGGGASLNGNNSGAGGNGGPAYCRINWVFT